MPVVLVMYYSHLLCSLGMYCNVVQPLPIALFRNRDIVLWTRLSAIHLLCCRVGCKRCYIWLECDKIRIMPDT